MTEEGIPAPPWERPRKRTVPARVPLTRERIVDAAFAVLDRDGYEKLSMRQVAAELGVAVSALYAHVSGKDELLDLMYHRLFDGMEVPDSDPDRWQEQLREHMRGMRARLLRHRDMARISMGRVPFTSELLPHVERLLAILRSAGLPDRVAAIAGDLISTYVEGFVLAEEIWQERLRTERFSWDDVRRELQEYFASLPADRFPNMIALADLMIQESNDYRFELGMEILLRGLASYVTEPRANG